MRIIAISLLTSTLVLPAIALAKSQVVKDPEGKTIAVVLNCSSCKGEKGSHCVTGVDDGFQGDASCGQCLMKSNFGTRISYGYDILLMGHLKDEKGAPA